MMKLKNKSYLLISEASQVYLSGFCYVKLIDFYAAGCGPVEASK